MKLKETMTYHETYKKRSIDKKIKVAKKQKGAELKAI
jgi:hypothetical protein